MDIGVFIPIGNNGWLISTTSPQYKHQPQPAAHRRLICPCIRKTGHDPA